MNIIAFDTSTEYCSLALWQNGTVSEREVLAVQQHSELLLPMLAALLNEHDLTLKQLDGIAYGAGPGSFTGLRIACGVAQGLAFAHDLPVVGIITLEAMAQQVNAERVLAALDARMGEIYFAAYEKSGADWLPVHVPLLCRPEAAPAVTGQSWVGCGSGFDGHADALKNVYAGRLQQIIPDCHPRAREMAQLAAARFINGEGSAPENAIPVYLRNKVALKESER
ncbi:tRNA (adenosine(37)-N6)-threonylcarbamoyltransferase complex dimerization subunit type 1 TsaB [Nitrosomonas sp. ANs5]|uniref:tRNA (adenosine(37)-N6)-threonylcarbamoyltransferase complex dimerization subunit type 1 TsaB n=1 Tax=Nitrosomonas sp. ANs5 TaxID=3423941 RepID=UPI003D34D867